MAVPLIPQPNAYATLGTSPRNQRFASYQFDVIIKDIAVANHNGLTGASNSPTGTLYAGSVLTKASDGNWYWYGVTLPTTSPTTIQAYMGLAAGGIVPLCVLIDSLDTTLTGVGLPVTGSGYFSGNFLRSFLLMGGASPASVDTIAEMLKANNIYYEGTTQVTTQAYGVDLPFAGSI